MNIVIAPDSFKGSLSAIDFCRIVAAQIHCLHPDAHLYLQPLADGGEGTIDAILANTIGNRISLQVHDPLGKIIDAQYAILDDRHTAIIEMAQASGLPLIQFNQYNPLIASSYGTGELLLDALDQGCRRFIIGLGGSATNDGGTGMLQALGVRFLDIHNHELAACGQTLSKIDAIDLTGFEPRLNDCEIIIAGDVINPLLGKNGATFIFGPQKGADQQALEQLEAGMKHFADKTESIFAAHPTASRVSGAGAAGGMGFALMTYCQAKMQSGFELLAEIAGLDCYFKIPENKVDLIITGEGCFDRQSLSGKLVGRLLERAEQYKIPLVILCGSIGEDIKNNEFSSDVRVFSLCDDGRSTEQSMQNTAVLLAQLIQQYGHHFLFSVHP
ncbi:MAG: glycerate kinase [Gammaproteobacteria bacterium]|nr:glycerate kinase [Gammaproteobacteria bacterium]